MKIEVAPWIRDYVVDMNELYTELALDKIHNKAVGQNTKELNHYTELFDKFKSNENVDNTDCSEQESSAVKRPKREYHISSSKQTKSDKILMKADPGMGKTTQCKKITFDWAMRLFTHFHIVLLVFLKLVNPGEAIENIIIKQNPYMKGLKITEQKLGSILDTLGSNCLLILDGLDEHALGTNNDVFSIIRGEKYLGCNIIVISRPHSSGEVERYFPTVVRVEGFTKIKATQFASKILTDEKDKSKIDDVLNFSPADFREDIPIHKCPILLSFICLLVKEDQIDLSDKSVDIGEIYFRMVRCLYKKFTIRKDREFEVSSFIQVLRLVGKLALQTLLSDDPLLRRSSVIKEVGSEAFDYGLLIGHEDAHRLIRDETADILVTFPHRTIQEFLGVLYFVIMLDEGQQVEALLGKNWIFMTNPLFLQFCLWLLHNGGKYFNFQRCQDVYNQLIDFCIEKINFASLDLTRIRARYAALNVKLAHDRKGKLHLKFLNDIIVKCDVLSDIVINHDDPLDWIFNSTKPILTGVRYIRSEQGPGAIVSVYFDIVISHVQLTAIVLKISHLSAKLNTILEGHTSLVGNRSVYLYLDRYGSLTEKSAENLSRLFVKNQDHNEWNSFSYPKLTHLCLERVYGKDNIPCLALPKREYFALLQNISLLSCKGRNVWLQSLFNSTWKQL